MTVGETTTSYFPLTELAVPPIQLWSVASPATIGAGNWSATSAVCWFTGKDLADALQVPIGLIGSNWGGTIIQSCEYTDWIHELPLAPLCVCGLHDFQPA